MTLRKFAYVVAQHIVHGLFGKPLRLLQLLLGLNQLLVACLLSLLTIVVQPASLELCAMMLERIDLVVNHDNN